MADTPSYDSRGLVNLVAEVERRLTGSSPAPGLDPAIASFLPDSVTYVMVLFDGLGMAQLDHDEAAPLRASLAATLDAPFPSTTSVSLATVATGLPPSRHGLIAHLAYLEEAGRVVNTLKWVDLSGNPVNHDYSSFLPRPNLWERLRSQGIEPITVQPSGFVGTPLSRLVYRGARFEAAWDHRDLVEATIALAAEPNRLVFTYFWPIDFAGHVHGLHSAEMSEAIQAASRLWEEIASQLPPGATLLATADHGLIDYAEGDKILIRDTRFSTLRFAGDPRGVRLWGDRELIFDLAEQTAGRLIEPMALLGADPTPETRARAGNSVLLAPAGKVLLPPGFDKRLRCYHGGVAPGELEIPLLLG